MDNILMSTNPSDPNDQFFIKLGDFGLSVIKTGTGLHGMLRERCGTILYMPPEILRQHSYSELCDVWSIGIIMYALLYGKYPFFSTVEEQLIEMICRSEPEYESVPINRDAVDLIQCALKKEPVNRITAVEMLTHPWLDNNKLRSRKGETIIDYMKKWKNEMLIPGGEENDWMSAVNNADDQHYSILCMKTDSQKPRAVNSFPNCGSYPSTTTASSNMSGQV